MVNGERRRDFEFREMTGELELMLNARTASTKKHVFNPVERVTHVLCYTLASIGQQDVTPEVVNALSVGDRQFLMRQLAVHMNSEPVWLTAVCRQCAEKFDVSFLYAELPVKSAGENYPSEDVEISLGKVSVSVPTGNDQLAIAEIDDHQQALWLLIERLVKVKGSRKKLRSKHLTAEDIEKIESIAETLSPEIATELLADCPNCNVQNRLNIAPYSSLGRSTDSLFNEVHMIALHYHWSEQAILDLPRSRRQHYLRLIDHSRGLADRQHLSRGGLHG